LLGFHNYGFYFLEFFFVPGVPFRLSPFLILIEFISFIFRSVSLALRLFANIVAGHILLDTVALSVYDLIHSGSFYFVFTFG
jgi:F0F1-type ATP synthase membrane subunit a